MYYEESIRKERHKQFYPKDSFCNDFNCSRISKSLKTTIREGKEDKAEALKKSESGKKDKDKKIVKDAKKLLWGFAAQQWLTLLTAAPFMFLGSLIIFLAPQYIGRIFD